MHIAVLAGGGVPNPTSGGGPLTAYTVLMHALDAGHRVTVIANYGGDAAVTAARVEHLRGVGAEVVTIRSRTDEAVADATRDLRSRARRLLAPSLADLFPHVADGAPVCAAVAEHGCEVAFVYHWEALAASRGLSVPRVAGVGDPLHLPRLYLWRAEFPSVRTLEESIHLQAALRRQPAAMATLLRECGAYGAFAAHHAAWFRSHGAPDCRYLHTPVPDEAGPGWADARRPRDPGEPARILLLGHLRGTATLDGLRVFGRMLPVLDRMLGRDGYVVDVVGGHEPPADLAHVFQHAAVRRHGHTDNAASWLRRADALLVPTSIPLGIRVRIITGLSFGTPIVTHSANAHGIPELEHDENALLGDTAEALAAEVVRLADDSGLQERLGRAARATYERSFSPPVAAGAILRLLEEVHR